MTTHIRIPTLATALVLAAGAPAFADDYDQEVSAITSTADNFTRELRNLDNDGSRAFRDWYLEGTCAKQYDKAAKAGVRADEILTSSGFASWRGAKQNAEGRWTIRFSDVRTICADFDQLARVAQVARALEQSLSDLGTARSVLKDQAQLGDDWWKGVVEDGQACTAVLDQAAKDGVPFDVPLKIWASGPWTLAQARVEICEALLATGEQMRTGIGAAKTAKRDAIAQKYTAHGIKGDRLELFIQYDNVTWMGPGCKDIDDVARLAKAKKLFQWLENSDGSHTIRKYTFKGNKYRISERTYDTEAKAWKGCK